MSADIWSLGVLTFEFLVGVGEVPFFHDDEEETEKRITRDAPDLWTPVARKYLSRMSRDFISKVCLVRRCFEFFGVVLSLLHIIEIGTFC